jgi:hypothetical protein
MRTHTNLARSLYTAVVAITLIAAYVWVVGRMQVNEHEVYSLNTVDAKPIPKWEFFTLWNGSIVDTCSAAAKSLGMATQTCRTAIADKHLECYQYVGAAAPATVSTTELAHDLSRKYLQCVTPYQYCQAMSGKGSAIENLCLTPNPRAAAPQAARPQAG